jgi:hypothetical protein
MIRGRVHLLLQRIAFAIVLTIGAINVASAQRATTPVIELTARGEIQIAPDGHVSDCLLKSDLAPTVAKLVDRTVRSWRFEPVVIDGKAVAAKTTMSIRLHGEPAPGDSYSLRIASVSFGVLTRGKLAPPEYPYDARRVGLGARVELYLVIDVNGKVVEATPRQTSLDMRARSEREAEVWRERFERASVKAAEKWRYDPSEFVDDKPMSKRYALAPIEFTITKRGAGSAESDWTAYVPGPVHPAPWGKSDADRKDEARFAQLSNGETASTNSHFHLKDDVVGKTL